MGYRIKETRKAMNMSQEDLAKKSGVSRTIIASLESGARKTTTTQTLVKLANALNTTVDAIFFTETA